MCRSEDRTDAGGLGLGAVAGFDSVGAGAAGVAGAAGLAASGALDAGSLILLLENISRSLDVSHWVYRFSVHAHLIVQMRAGGPSGATHISNMIPTRDPLADLHTDLGVMSVKCLNPEGVFDPHKSSKTGLPAGMCDHAICGCKEIGALAQPDDIRFTAALPKTRSGKIMRRLLRDIAAGKEASGDTTTLEDYTVLAKLRDDEE